MKSFKDVAEELLARGEGAPSTKRQHAWLLERLTELHSIPIAKLKTPDLFKALKKIGETTQTARLAKMFTGRVLRLAIAQGDREEGSDFTGSLRGVMKRAAAPVARAAITDPTALGGLLRAIGGMGGSQHVRRALRLAAHLFVRPSELRGMRWGEIDIIEGIWTIPAERMKKRRSHIVPLSSATLSILAECAPSSSATGFVFPGRRPGSCLSENMLTLGLRSLMYGPEEMSVHGFRATASTLLREAGGFEDELIELQLAHIVGSRTRRAYDRAARISEREAMMQWWSDYLVGLSGGAL